MLHILKPLYFSNITSFIKNINYIHHASKRLSKFPTPPEFPILIQSRTGVRSNNLHF